MASLGALMGPMINAGAQAGGAAGTIGGAPAAGASPWAGVGAGLQAGGQIFQGIAAKKASDSEAKQYMAKAAEEKAAGSYAAYEKGKETDKLVSRQTAVGAAGGAGGVGLLDIIADTQMRGDYLRDMELATAENRSRGMADKAAAAKVKGKNALIGSFLEAGTSIAKGAYKGNYRGKWG